MNTYVLFWNPDNSWYDLGTLSYEMEEGMCGDDTYLKYWQVKSNLPIKKGDRCFIVCTQENVPDDNSVYDFYKRMGATFFPFKGICFGGRFASDIKNDPEDGRCVKLYLDFAIQPGMFKTITNDVLQSEIPEINWNQEEGECLIDEANVHRLDELMLNWLKSSHMDRSNYTNFTDRDIDAVIDNLSF